MIYQCTTCGSVQFLDDTSVLYYERRLQCVNAPRCPGKMLRSQSSRGVASIDDARLPEMVPGSVGDLNQKAVMAVAEEMAQTEPVVTLEPFSCTFSVMIGNYGAERNCTGFGVEELSADIDSLIAYLERLKRRLEDGF